jgi:hypothetical protein
MPLAYAVAVFVIVPVDNVMAAVFDAPVTTVDGKYTFGVGLLGSSTGYAIGEFTGVFAGFFINGLPLYEESLSEVGEIEIVVEFGCGPD